MMMILFCVLLSESSASCASPHRIDRSNQTGSSTSIECATSSPNSSTERFPRRRRETWWRHGPGPSFGPWGLMSTYHTYPSRGSRKMGWTRANNPVFSTIVSICSSIDVVLLFIITTLFLSFSFLLYTCIHVSGFLALMMARFFRFDYASFWTCANLELLNF